jgi:hypothetical protein
MTVSVPQWLIEETKAEMSAEFVLTEGITDEEFSVSWDTVTHDSGAVRLYMNAVIGDSTVRQVRKIEPIIEGQDKETPLNG